MRVDSLGTVPNITYLAFGVNAQRLAEKRHNHNPHPPLSDSEVLDALPDGVCKEDVVGRSHGVILVGKLQPLGYCGPKTAENGPQQPLWSKNRQKWTTTTFVVQKWPPKSMALATLPAWQEMWRRADKVIATRAYMRHT
jgi:hypothetical protein